MNRKIALTFVLASVAAASAFAETPMVNVTPWKASMTREQVQAELKQHLQSGVDVYADGYNQLTGLQSTRTRAEVSAEYRADRDIVRALNSEDGGARYLTHREQPRMAGAKMAAH